jgi:Nucleotidyl transferase AbiEii toxin, Type IV TA system
MGIGTVPSAQQAAIAVVANLPLAARLARAAAMNRAADALALAGLRRRQPNASPHAIGVALALQRIGRFDDRTLAAHLTKETTVSDTPADFLAVAVRAAAVCTDLSIPYLIGGGVASTVHGEFRTTRDVDLVVQLNRADAARFAAALAADFTLNPPDVLDALVRVPMAASDRTQRATFAAYDRTTGYQLDVFCVSDSPFDRAQFDRAIPIVVPEVGAVLMVASAEDTIITKLEWYALTPSDQQWADVQTILRVQGQALDQQYVTAWAARLGIAEVWAAAQRGDPTPHQTAARSTPSDDAHQTRMDL